MSAKAGVPQSSHKPQRARVSTAWQDHAACAGADPDLFSTRKLFPQALLICEPCPVKEQCREHGRGLGEGVWGGVIQKGRPSISMADYLQEPCGTLAGYCRHIRAHDPPCPACTDANTRSKIRSVS